MSEIKLFHGDCLELLKDISDNSIDLIVTDPPYKTISGGNSNGANSVRPKGMLDGNRKLFKYQTTIKISEWMPELFRVLKNGSHAYIFTNALNMQEMLCESEKAGFKLHNILVWEKNNCTPSQFYMKNCEYVLFLRKGTARYINNIGDSKTVHQYNNILGKKTHPCEKPVPLLKFYISNSSNENDIVLDPFMGTGSCAIACKELNRNFIGFELDKNFFDIAQEKVRNHTNACKLF